MRLVSYNILNGGLGRADPIAEILEAQKADVITLLEADDLGVIQHIAHRLGMDFVEAPGRRHTGAILSRLPIRESVNHSLLQSGITNTLVEAVVHDASGSEWRIMAMHLHPHATVADEQIRMGEIRAVLSLTKAWRANGVAHLLAGDFNSNSPTQRIARERCKPHTQRDWDANGGVIPREVVATLLQAGYVDTLESHHGNRAGEMGSFSTQFPGQRVDFVFAHGVKPEAITDAWIETDRLARFASDHFPIGAEIRVAG